MRITFIHPPLDDPTIPYHSMAYLAGHLAQNGFSDFALRDINIEFVNYCLEKENINRFYDEGEERIRRLEARGELNFREQENYIALWSHSRINDDELQEAVRGMRDKELFLDYEAYNRNVALLMRYFAYLGALSYPSDIAHFKQMSRARYSIYHLDDLFGETLSEEICYVFGQFFRERLVNDPGFLGTDCFGISIVYDHQMPHALYLARALRRLWPEKPIILGGTSVSQIYKYLRDKRDIKRFFSLCDAIVVGEGETAICEIASLGKDFLKRKNLTNTITYDAGRDEVTFPQQIHYEDVKSLGTPLYTYPWELYLSPEKGINYAPTRGCYWNRCTFCDYGLNTDGPTSPWRERKIEQVVADLQKTCEQEKVKYVYFAVDVMAPGYIERLADAMVEAGLDIRWSAEMRMEKIFSAERCEKMARSGAVCISFGMESGNQRILDLIDKGTKVQYMGETMKNFAGAGVGVQLMAFTDFPTERPSEKKETYDFVREHEEYWSTGGIGRFLLTGTSIIAKDPERFGIKLIETEDADVARAIAFKIDTEGQREVLLTEDSDASFDEDGGIFPRVPGRPWAGGTDSLHTMIYYNAYGRNFFKEHPLDNYAVSKPVLDEEIMRSRLVLPGRLNQSSFDITQVLKNRVAFSEHISHMLLVAVEPTYEGFRRWQANVEPITKGTDPGYWIIAASKSAKLDRLIYQVLSLAIKQDLTLDEILSAFKPEMRERLLNYFKELESNRLVEFNDPLRAKTLPAPSDVETAYEAVPVDAPEPFSRVPAAT
jgi:anaerobic magnesium-protoporphyrin IX monomethyl ester cyclase